MVVTIIGRIIAIRADMGPSVCRRNDRGRRGDGCECDDTLAAARRTPRRAEGAMRANWPMDVCERPSSRKSG